MQVWLSETGLPHSLVDNNSFWELIQYFVNLPSNTIINDKTKPANQRLAPGRKKIRSTILRLAHFLTVDMSRLRNIHFKEGR